MPWQTLRKDMQSKPDGSSPLTPWICAVYFIFGTIPAFFLIVLLLPTILLLSPDLHSWQGILTIGWLLLDLFGCIGLIMAAIVRPGMFGRKPVVITVIFLASGFIGGAVMLEPLLDTIARIFCGDCNNLDLMSLTVLICMALAVLYFLEAGFTWIRSAARSKHPD